MRRLCVCVDDFGLDPGVAHAVEELAAIDRVHATSCMVGAPHWRTGAPRARRLADAGIDIGLHLDFTEWPCPPARRRSLPTLIATAWLRGLDRERLQRAIEAQFDAFEDALGSAPAFVDGHQHVHQLPQVALLLVGTVVRRYGQGRLPWMRSTRRPRGSLPALLPQAGKAAVIEHSGDAALRRACHAAGIAQNAHLLGVYGFDADAAGYARHLDDWLDAAADTDLLMCHPAIGAGAGTAHAGARALEARVLASATFGRDCARRAIALRPLSGILRAADPAPPAR